MAAVKAVMFSLMLLSSFCHSQDNSALLTKVIDAVEKLLSFYKNNYQYLNLDGLYGLRVLEGQVQTLMEEHKSGKHHHLDTQTVRRLDAIQQSATQISQLALDPVHRDDEGYFNDLSLLVKTPWLNFKPHRQIAPSKRWEIPVYNSAQHVRIEEDISNACMMEMTLPEEDKLGNNVKCELSQNCSDIMTKRGLTDYGITHQLLWTAVAEKVDCEKEMNALLRKSGFPSIDEFQTEFCTNNFFEMLAVVHVYMKGKIQLSYQDLFLEQQFVCPNMGFYEFLKKDYLDQILSWQMPSGCFGDAAESVKKVDTIPPELDLKKLFASQKPVGAPPKAHELHKPLQQAKLPVSRLRSNDEKGPSRNHPLKKFNEVHRQFGNAQGAGQVPGIDTPSEGEDQQNHVFQNKAVPLQQPVAAGNLQQQDVDGGRDDRIRFPAKLDLQDNMVVKQEVEQNPRLPRESKDRFVGESLNLVREPSFNADSKKREVQMRRLLSYHTSLGNSRRLLSEKEMPGECLAHKTGVASGALVMYLRYLVDPGPLDLVSPHNFFPENPEGGEVFKTFISNLEELYQHGQTGKNQHPGRDVGNAAPAEGQLDQNAGEENGEGEENEEENVQDYDDNEEMYPDTGGGIGQQEKKRVVHFGANEGVLHKDKMGDAYNNKDEAQYVDDNDYEEEEGPDYIKRVKGDDDGGDTGKADEEDQQDDDTEYTYYDDNDNVDQGVIKKHRPQPASEHGARIRSHGRHKSVSVNSSNSDFLGQPDSPPTKAIILLLTASSVLLIIFIYRFIKKRRIHIRYHSRGHSRGFFRL